MVRACDRLLAHSFCEDAPEKVLAVVELMLMLAIVVCRAKQKHHTITLTR